MKRIFRLCVLLGLIGILGEKGWGQTYCTPSGSTSSSTYISNFTITGGVTNFNNSSTYSSGGYGNYSASISSSQVIGSSVNYSVTHVGGTTGTAIWVDWNHNGVFTDAGENVYIPELI